MNHIGMRKKNLHLSLRLNLMNKTHISDWWENNILWLEWDCIEDLAQDCVITSASKSLLGPFQYKYVVLPVQEIPLRMIVWLS